MLVIFQIVSGKDSDLRKYPKVIRPKTLPPGYFSPSESVRKFAAKSTHNSYEN